MIIFLSGSKIRLCATTQKAEERGSEDPLFRELKNEGHNFTRDLMKLFEATFDSTHPIHRAVIFYPKPGSNGLGEAGAATSARLRHADDDTAFAFRQSSIDTTVGLSFGACLRS